MKVVLQYNDAKNTYLGNKVNIPVPSSSIGIISRGWKAKLLEQFIHGLQNSKNLILVIMKQFTCAFDSEYSLIMKRKMIKQKSMLTVNEADSPP